MGWANWIEMWLSGKDIKAGLIVRKVTAFENLIA